MVCVSRAGHRRHRRCSMGNPCILAGVEPLLSSQLESTLESLAEGWATWKRLCVGGGGAESVRRLWRTRVGSRDGF